MQDNISQDVAIRGESNIVVGRGDVIINPLPPAEARLRQDLGILLKNVENTWIKGVLEKSIHEIALLELGMELRDEAIDNPWRTVIEGPEQPRKTLPRGRKIKDIFDESNRLLLIIGEPGSGKTTTLLQLARDLIGEVDSAFTQPVPVIFNLSSWENKQPLDKWLVAELNSKYHVPRKDGDSWLKERRILPLLDGLDELKVGNRAPCVEKINQLKTDYGLQGLAVCTRLKEYIDLNVRLAFYRAIYLQPLTPEHISEYLDLGGDKLISLRTTLQSDESLRSMAQSPLILNIMSLAYQNASTETLRNPALITSEDRRQLLFDFYIARMFTRKGGSRSYSDERTRKYLSWLARNMQRHNQAVFLIDSLQSSWLETRYWQWLYILLSRLIGGLSFGLIFALVLELGVSKWLRLGATERLMVRLLLGLSIGLFLGIIDLLRLELFNKWSILRRFPKPWWSAINVGLVSLIIGLTIELIVIPIIGTYDSLISGWIIGPIAGFIFGLRGSRDRPNKDIQTVEALHWSWLKALKGGLMGGMLAGLLGLISGFLFGLSGGRNLLVNMSSVQFAGLSSGLRVGLIYGLFGILIGGPIAVVFSGLTQEIVKTKSFANQGIWLSIRNAIFSGMIVSLVLPTILWLILGLSFRLISGILGRQLSGLGDLLVVGLIVWMLFGPILGLLSALWFGGFDVIQHCVLRLLLTVRGHTPGNYAHFLDYAVNRIFLQKVGGGYRFIHRLLLEHFADMDKVQTTTTQS
jgi:eukaryotic-like serine/threonine-protein kinase